jgi:hypothetical protein
MNHSELVRARNLVKLQINEVADLRERARADMSEAWVAAHPYSRIGRFAWECFKKARKDFDRYSKDLRALEALSYDLRSWIRDECRFVSVASSGWPSDDEVLDADIEFTSRLHDESYEQKVFMDRLRFEHPVLAG